MSTFTRWYITIFLWFVYGSPVIFPFSYKFSYGYVNVYIQNTSKSAPKSGKNLLLRGHGRMAPIAADIWVSGASWRIFGRSMGYHG